MILCLNTDRASRSINALYPVRPHAFTPYVSEFNPLCFNAVSIRNLPNAPAKLRAPNREKGEPSASDGSWAALIAFWYIQGDTKSLVKFLYFLEGQHADVIRQHRLR